MPVHIISDTTAEITADLRQKWDVKIVPQYIHFGEETARDELDISADEFYRRQAQATDLPKTSAPPPADFIPLFNPILTNDREATILCIHPSAAVSGTVRSAQLARSQTLEEFPEADVRVIDTKVVSVGLGLLVLEAARLAAAGHSADHIEGRLQQWLTLTKTYFVVDTLEYLAKGGRIGRASHLMGSLLDIKPILTLEGGVVESHSKARTRKRSLQTLGELVIDAARTLREQGGALHLGVAHARCEQEARQLSARLEAELQPDFSLFTINGPAIGVHAGPGSLAISCLGIP